MHAKGTIHRDFNPKNVFLTADWKVKVIDFNVSKWIESETSGNKQTDSKFRYSLFTKTGTPVYTAPEMHLGCRYS